MSIIRTLLVVGYGRHGKDEFASYLASITTLRYGGSTAWAALPYVAERMGIHPQIAWDTRHQHRHYWKKICDDLRKDDQCRLAVIALRSGEIVTGVRDKVELDAIRREKLFSRIVWLRRADFPADPTVTFNAEDCDEVFYNSEDLCRFHFDIDLWARLNGIILRQ